MLTSGTSFPGAFKPACFPGSQSGSFIPSDPCFPKAPEVSRLIDEVRRQCSRVSEWVLSSFLRTFGEVDASPLQANACELEAEQFLEAHSTSALHSSQMLTAPRSLATEALARSERASSPTGSPGHPKRQETELWAFATMHTNLKTRISLSLSLYIYIYGTPPKTHALMLITRSFIFDGKKLQLRVWSFGDPRRRIL